jgi:outer membrane biosynthesis protein TonB
MQISMSEKLKIKSLQKRAREVLLAGGVYWGAKAVGMTPLALVSFVHGYARPQKRTLESLEKYLPKVNLAKLRAEAEAASERGKKKKPKVSKPKAKTKPKAKAKSSKPKAKAASKPKAKASKPKASKPKAKASSKPKAQKAKTKSSKPRQAKSETNSTPASTSPAPSMPAALA